MSSNFVGHGTITTNTTTDEVSVSGWATLSAHYTGAATTTWEFKGADGVWRTILAAVDNITPQVYTVSNMLNVFFGTGIKVRATISGNSTDVYWQIMGNPSNRTS